MFSAQLREDVCRAGAGVNLAEKEACMVFLNSTLFGRTGLRVRICEFVLTKKELRLGPLNDDAQKRCDRIAASLVGKTVSEASFSFSSQYEGIELLLTTGEHVVVSGFSRKGDGDLRTVMWVRPSFDAFEHLRIERVSAAVLFNPFIKDRYAPGNGTDPQEMEVLLLVSGDREVLIGGHTGCTGCMEGCGVYSVSLQLFDVNSHVKFHNLPHLAFGNVRLLDRNVFRLVDEFGSRLEWIIGTSLDLMLYRYPLSGECAAALHEYFNFMVDTWPATQRVADRTISCFYLGDTSSSPIGTLLPATAAVMGERLKTARDYRMPHASPSSWVSVDQGLLQCLSIDEKTCCWIWIKNPTCDDVEAVLKFASACTVILSARCIVVCLADVALQFRETFVDALQGSPSAARMLFDVDPAVWAGHNSCMVGVGWDRLYAPPTVASDKATASIGQELGGAASEDPVIQNVSFADDVVAVAISAEESQLVANELWASGVERRIQASVPEMHNDSTTKGFVLKLLTFSRHPENLDLVLLQSPFVQALIGQGLDPKPAWANGARVLATSARPEQIDIELCPRHVIVEEANEQMVMNLIEQLPYNQRPRLKPGVGRAAVPSELSLLQDASENDDRGKLHDCCHYRLPIDQEDESSGGPTLFTTQILSVRNTFIDCPPSPVVTPRTVRSI